MPQPDDVFARLQQLLREVFGDDTLVVTDATTADDVDGWDSLMHVNIIIAIEKRFGVKFAAAETPQWNPMNSCGYHYMESGASPAEEVGYAIGNAILILEAIRPVRPADAFASVVDRISYFINSGIELVPEIRIVGETA